MRQVVWFDGYGQSMSRKGQNLIAERPAVLKPLMKWAGGKTQMLDVLAPLVPQQYGKYIEPFFGGGALFFHLRPQRAVIADSNFELISLYRTVATNALDVIEVLGTMRNEEAYFYEVRKQCFTDLDPVTAAARTIFLNRTCFNGLYRVNRKGHFNVPYGRYKTLSLPSRELMEAAAQVLRTATIVHGDYRDVLKNYAQPGDFVFLDPPYLPVGVYSDFRRYTRDQFGESDHCNLAAEVHRLVELGVNVLLTNSDHPLVAQLYGDFEIQVIPTKRFINSRGSGRSGRDAIVIAKPASGPKKQ